MLPIFITVGPVVALVYQDLSFNFVISQHTGFMNALCVSIIYSIKLLFGEHYMANIVASYLFLVRLLGYG